MGRVVVHIIPAIATGFIIQLVIHEVGHLIGGLLTGWRFLYIQIHNIVVKKEDKGLKLVVVKDKGYKCIMYPTSINEGALLYTMGGCVVNLLTGIAGLILMIFTPMSPILWLYIWSLLVFGIGMFLINGTASIKRLCNDRACYDLLKNDIHTKVCHNSQLLIAKYLMRGSTYNKIGEELMSLCQDAVKNDIEAYQAVLEYYYNLDSNNYLKMGQALNKIQDKSNISKEVLDIIDMELIYVRLLCAIELKIKDDNNPSNPLSRVVDGDTHSIKVDLEEINSLGRKGSVHSLRIKAVYETYMYFVAGNKTKSIDNLNEAIRLMTTYNYVYEGEKKFCLRQLKKIKNLLDYEVEEKESDRIFAKT